MRTVPLRMEDGRIIEIVDTSLEFHAHRFEQAKEYPPEVVVTAFRHRGGWIASAIEPQLGACCGGPHCDQ